MPLNPLGVRLFGRLVAQNVVDPKTGELLAERDDVLDHDVVKLITEVGM